MNFLSLGFISKIKEKEIFIWFDHKYELFNIQKNFYSTYKAIKKL